MDPLDWKTRHSFRKLQPRALVSPTLRSVDVRATDKSFNNLSRPLFRELLARRTPWTCRWAELHERPELERALSLVWDEAPEVLLFVPILDTVPVALCIVGRREPPDAETLAALILTVTRTIRTQRDSREQAFQRFEIWADHPSPTLVIDSSHGTPYLNRAARRLLGREHFNDLDEVLGPEAFAKVLRTLNAGGRAQTFTLPFTYSGDSDLERRFEAIVTPGPDSISMVLQDLGVPNLAKRRERVLLWLTGEPATGPVALGPRPTVNLGRDARNDIVLADSQISRFHASFKVRGMTVTLEDLGSSNGVIVNGRRRAQVSLAAGDELRIGPFAWRVQGPEAEVSAGALPGAAPTAEQQRANTARRAALAAAPKQPAPGSGPAQTQAPRVGEDDGASLRGRLASFSLVAIARLIELQRAEGELVLASSEGEGRVRFRDGQVHSAEAAGILGADALAALIDLEDGEFRFTEGPVEGPGLGRSLAEITGLVGDPRSPTAR